MTQVPYTSWGSSKGRGPQAIELIRGRSSWATGLNAHSTTTDDDDDDTVVRDPRLWNSSPTTLRRPDTELGEFQLLLKIHLVTVA